MNRFKSSTATILTLALGALALLGLSQSDAQAQSPTPPAKVKVVNTPDVRIEKTLLSGGILFYLNPDPNVAFELEVPAGVVLTDLVLTLNAPSLATTIFVQGLASGTMVYESVGSAGSTWAANTTGRSTVHLESGLTDPYGIRIGIICNNIGGNLCSGALMWSGYQP